MAALWRFQSNDKEDSDIIHRFRILNKVPLNDSNQEVKVNFIEYWEYSTKKDKVTYHNTWVSDFTLTQKNAYTIMRGGRARWKKAGSKKALWESIRSYFKCFLFESMEMLYNALLYGINVQSPVILL